MTSKKEGAETHFVLLKICFTKIKKMKHINTLIIFLMILWFFDFRKGEVDELQGFISGIYELLFAYIVSDFYYKIMEKLKCLDE